MTTDEALKELALLRSYLVRKTDEKNRPPTKSETHLFDALQVAIRAMEETKQTKGNHE